MNKHVSNTNLECEDKNALRMIICILRGFIKCLKSAVEIRKIGR